MFFGRFTAALRVLIPGLAGMARMPYRRFAAYNVAGGVLWATQNVLLGYLAGASWQRAAHLASRIGLGLLALLALGAAVFLLIRATRRRTDRLRAIGDRLAATRPATWIRRRFPTQLAWARRRLDPATTVGLALTATVTIGALCAWTFAALTQDVITNEETATLDPRAETFALAHRASWLTPLMQAVSWLGSNLVLVPLLATASAFLLLARRDRRSAVELWAAYLGAVGSYALTKPLVGRARPPAAELLGHANGPAYPSGHATQAIVVWGMLVFLLWARRSPRGRALLLTGAAAVVLLVGASRVYLATHWLTDVLAGYALGGTWLALILTIHLHHQPATDTPTPDRGNGANPPYPATPNGDRRPDRPPPR